MTCELAELTSKAVAEHVARSPRVLVPVGSTEQHGPHAPLGTDAILASHVCQLVAPRVDALVAPSLSYGVSIEHDGFAGLVSLSPLTMIALVRDVCSSLASSGFRWIALINGHYTNVVALDAAVMEANDVLPADSVAYWFNYWDALSPDVLRTYLGEEAGLHANIGETSAVMAVDPSLVHLDAAVEETPSFPGSPSEAARRAYFFSGRGALRRALPTGVWGNPAGSTAEAGTQFLGQIEDAVVAAIRDCEAAFETFGRPGRE